MSWTIKTIKNHISGMKENIADMNLYTSFEALLLSVDLTPYEFDKHTENYKDENWFKIEIDKLKTMLIGKIEKWGMMQPGRAAMCQLILKNNFGIGSDEVTTEDMSKIEVVRTIINKKENIETGI